MSTSVENPTRHSSNGSAESYALPTVAERLGGLLWTLRRRWWILLLLPLLAGGAAWYVAAGDQKQYSATAKVLLSDAAIVANSQPGSSTPRWGSSGWARWSSGSGRGSGLGPPRTRSRAG